MRGLGVGVFLLAASLAGAGPTRHVQETLGGSLNVIGIQNNFEVYWRWGLSRSENPLLKDAHFSFGFNDSFSPAYNRIAAWVELSPLSILDLRAGIEPALYFGTYNALQDFSSYDDLFDEDTRRDTNSRAKAGFGGRVYLAPTFKIRFGRVVFASSAEFEWWKAGNDGPYFYENTRDLLMKSDGDGVMQTSTVLLYEIPRGEGKLLVGPIHNITDVHDSPQNKIERLGVLGVYEIAPRRWGVGQPTVIFHLARYLEDRYKKDELTAVLAVRFQLGAKPH
jgi:hypothetical protein